MPLKSEKAQNIIDERTQTSSVHISVNPSPVLRPLKGPGPKPTTLVPGLRLQPPIIHAARRIGNGQSLLNHPRIEIDPTTKAHDKKPPVTVPLPAMTEDAAAFDQTQQLRARNLATGPSCIGRTTGLRPFRRIYPLEAITFSVQRQRIAITDAKGALNRLFRR